ncbi:MAG: DNA primase, partial [Victivallales bacterium]|nr:DNA primase [Victivallales bacterium]
MRIPERIIEEIRQRADIGEVARDFMELKRSGDGSFKACCPFHHEKTPSFSVNTTKQVYHCFGCGVGGNVITLVKGLVNTDFVGAIRWLGRKYNIDIPEEYDSSEGDSAEAARRRRLREEGMRLLNDAAGWFQSQLNTPAGAEARSYLASRGIDQETISKFRIGLAPEGWDSLTQWARTKGYSRDALIETGLCLSKEGQQRLYDRFRNRIMFTICDELSRPVAFSGRLYAANQPPNAGGKYVNSPESEFFHKSRVLYGFNFARSAFKNAGWALVCEGQLDVIACHRSGLEQAIAAQGTAFTEEHARMLRKANVSNVHLAFDGDAAGLKAALRTIKLLHAESIHVMVTPLPGGADPDSIFRSGGPDALKKIMDHAVSAVEFSFNTAKAAHPEDTPEAKSAVVSEMLDVIASIQDGVARSGHCQLLAKSLSLPENVIFDELALRQKNAAENARRTQSLQQLQQQTATA